VCPAAGGRHCGVDGAVSTHHQHGHVFAVDADLAQHLEPVDVGQLHVEQDGVVALGLGALESELAAARHIDVVALDAERAAQRDEDVFFVVDDQDRGGHA